MIQLQPGTVLLDRYELVRCLGSGGMANAWLALDRLWRTQLALKLVRAPSAALRDALRSEFELLRGLSHPALLPVHDFGLIDPGSQGSAGSCFYTSDFVDGCTLSEAAAGRAWAAVATPLADALCALRLLHACGLRHGDFKPSNIL